ncbi:MAG: NDP-sugar synthase [Acidobacteriota bacterium]|nr:NDP-sugar synthase [Acidobacteriota bacterium]MDQ5835889.1 NDP-sugar synthase [Acidobacteriota bacterium]
MRAMILAAGYGTRLWPLTIDRAKPAIPFMGRPLVGYVAEYLARYGFREIVVNLHHRPESVRAALGDGTRFGVRFHYVNEPTILGTGGALDNARTLLEGGTFVVVNGKIATDINLDAALETHRRTRALATLVLRANTSRERYSIVRVSGGLVTGFGGHPASDNASGAASTAQKEGAQGSVEVRSGEDNSVPLMFTGIQVLDPRIFEFIPRGVFSHTVTDTYVPAIARGERIAAHLAEGSWYELSTVRRYLETSVALLKSEGRGVEVGEGSFVEEGAEVSESVLWEGVRVEAGARVRRAVLGAGVRIASGAVVENAAVVRAELARESERPPKGLEGELRGSNFVAPIPE